jgi:hypothetical protein
VSGITNHHRIWSDVAGNYCTRAKYCPVANTHTRQNRYAHPNPYIVADRYITIACWSTVDPRSRQALLDAEMIGRDPVCPVVSSGENLHARTKGAEGSNTYSAAVWPTDRITIDMDLGTDLTTASN